MKQILVGKDVNYGASKASATHSTATDPSILANGAIGIYAEDVSNEGKFILITEANDATQFPATVRERKKFFVAQGTADGCIMSSPITPAYVSRFSGQEYTAPVKQVSYIGFNGTSGDLNLPATISNNDEATVKVINVTDGRQQYGKRSYTASLIDSETTYGVLKKVVDVMVANNTNEDSIVKGEVIGNGTVTEAAQDATVTNGSKSVTFAGNVTIATGAFISVRGAIYKVDTGVTAGTSITLDRPYQGDTETIDVSATTDLVGVVASTTKWGIKITAKSFGTIFRIARQGVLENADIQYTTNPNPGSGTYEDILAIEKECESYSKGYTNKVYFPRTPQTYAVSGETYDKYVLDFKVVADGKDISDRPVGNPQSLIVAFPDDANGSNENAAGFQAIVNQILGSAVDVTD